jgi:hypothetical protein
MRQSTDRILVSHAGNLPRPVELNQLVDDSKDIAGAAIASKRLWGK